MIDQSKCLGSEYIAYMGSYRDVYLKSRYHSLCTHDMVRRLTQIKSCVLHEKYCEAGVPSTCINLYRIKHLFDVMHCSKC